MTAKAANPLTIPQDKVLHRPQEGTGKDYQDPMPGIDIPSLDVGGFIGANFIFTV